MSSTTEHLRGIAEAATPGPWKVDDDFLVTEDPVELEYERRAIADLRYFHMPKDRQNAAFIATFDPPTVLSLLDALARDQARIAELEEALRFSTEILEEARERIDYAPGSLGQIEIDEAIETGYALLKETPND